MTKLKGYLSIVGGILIHLTLGTIYTYGNMAPYIVSYMRKYNSPDIGYYDFTVICAAVSFGQGITLYLGGFIEQMLGVRLAALIGTTLFSSSVALSSVTVQKSFAWMLATYGFCCGFGIGLGYIPALVCVNKWFPDNKGLVNGLIAAGFGGGAFMFNIIQTYYINPQNLHPNIVLNPNNNTEQFYGQDSVLEKVPSAFLMLAAVYGVLQLTGIALLSEPPQIPQVRKLTVKSNLISDDEDEDDDLVHPSHLPRVEEDPSFLDPKSSGMSLRPLEMLRKPNFWILWFTFMMNAQVVVFMSTLYKAFGQTFIQNDKLLAVIGSMCAIFNACGRICWGQLVDKTSFKFSMCMLTVFNAILLFTFGMTTSMGIAMYFIWICAIFFTFSGNFVLFPTASARAFGIDHFGPNYGVLFTSMAAASVVVSLLAKSLQNVLGFNHLFQLCGGFSCVAFILTILFSMKRLDGGFL